MLLLLSSRRLQHVTLQARNTFESCPVCAHSVQKLLTMRSKSVTKGDAKFTKLLRKRQRWRKTVAYLEKAAQKLSYAKECAKKLTAWAFFNERLKRRSAPTFRQADGLPGWLCYFGAGFARRVGGLSCAYSWRACVLWHEASAFLCF